MNEVKFKHECSEENAPKFWEWLNSRGGIAVWKSINLGNAGASWSTPALMEDGKPYEKPTWQASNTPTVYTDPADVGVFTSALYKAFKVGLKRGDGFSFVLTDAASAKVNRLLTECEEKHGDAFYRKGVLDIDGASIGIYYTTGIEPISEWAKRNGLEVKNAEVEQ